MMRFAIAVSLSLLVPAAADAQPSTRVVAGRVVDALTRRPLPGGVVALTSGAVSDRLRPDGVFVLRVPAGEARVTVRSPGYERLELVVPEGEEAVIIALEPLAHALDAVVVRETMVREVRPHGATLSLDDALGARVAGLESMRNSGAPGDVQVRLRGVSTILGHGRPLWVLDGVVIQDAGPSSGAAELVGGTGVLPSRIADLNPHDVASVEVLRGASAAAMYGSRGANGVVIVRTKRR